MKPFYNFDDMKPFNKKNTITEMYTSWKLISMINIYFM